jgi:hypothetical protein
MGGNLGRVRELLDRHWPQPGEEEIRGWEWPSLAPLKERRAATLGFH